MKPSYLNIRRSSGFSLVEMMVAMLIGLIIMAGVMQIFVSSSDTHRANEDHLIILADTRFALETIAFDLRHAGLWGRNSENKSIACQKAGVVGVQACPDGNAMPVVASDCEPGEYINLMRPLFATNDINNYGATCAAQSYKGGTDVLSLRYADTNQIGTTVLSAGVAYIRSSAQGGMLFLGPTLPDVQFPHWDDDIQSSNHLLMSRVYYVSTYTDVVGDGKPSLRRADLVQGPQMESDILLPGVEDFQLEFGVDIGTNGVAGQRDGQVDSYVNASNVTSWQDGEVQAVRIWLLMRALREDKDSVAGSQTFNIAGKTVTTPSDGYVRYLVSSVVKLRNTTQQDLLTAGSN